MTSSEKRGLVPKLRFPEFREAGEWEQRKIGTVATLHKGKGISKAEIVANGTQPCIRYGELYTIYGETIHETASSTNVNASELFLSKKNDVIIPASGETKIDIAKASCVMNDDIALGGDLNVIRSSQNGIFLSYQLNGSLRLSIAKVAQGDTVVHLYPTQIERLDVFVPSPPEQQKIADCLASLDELITLEVLKLDTLKTHKKGLMQQLFPAEGETLPKLRFPEFRDAGEWGEHKFGELIKVNSGKGFKAAEYCKYGVRLLQIENVGYGITKWNGETIYLPQNYSTEYPELVLREGDIVLALNRPVTNDELKIAQLQKEDELSLLYQRVGKLELLSESVVRDFVFHVCRIFIKNFVIKQSIGSDQPFISVTTLYAQKILIPLPGEQQKIADCLASLDDLITTQTHKLAALKIHKKGLMQQLFPVLDEVQE